MEKEKVITKRDVCNYGLERYPEDEVLVKYFTHELEMLDKKNSNRSNKSNEEDTKLIDMIINALEDMTTGEKTLFTVTEILNHETLRDYECESTGKVLSNSKVTSLLQKEYKSPNARIVNTKDKKNSFYSLV